MRIPLSIFVLSALFLGCGEESSAATLLSKPWPTELKDGPAIRWEIENHPRVESEIFVVDHSEKGFKAVYETVQSGVPQRVTIPLTTERLFELNETLKGRSVCEKQKAGTINAGVKAKPPGPQDIATANASATMVLHLPDHDCTIEAPIPAWRDGDLIWLDGVVRGLHRRGSVLTL